ncbi:hypothetical protein [Castellaniella sp.]
MSLVASLRTCAKVLAALSVAWALIQVFESWLDIDLLMNLTWGTYGCG